MTKQFFQGYDIYALFQQVGGIGVAQGMQVNLFGDGSFLKVFAHHPGESANAVPAIGFLAVEQPDVRVLCCQVFSQPNGHTVGQWDYPVLLVFALPDVDGLSFEACAEPVEVSISDIFRLITSCPRKPAE